MMNKKERWEMERLKRLLEVERQRAEKAWEGYRDALYENTDLRMKLEAVAKAVIGEPENEL